MKPFSLDLNLDDPNEAEFFWHEHCISTDRRVAKRLNIQGKGAYTLARALRNYAANKVTAISLRTKGDVTTALKYEEICDTIYKRDIQPVCDCW